MLTIHCLIHGNKALEGKSAAVNIPVPTMFNYQSGLLFCKLLQDHKIIKFEDGEIEDPIKAQERIINEKAKTRKDLPGTGMLNSCQCAPTQHTRQELEAANL